MKSLNLSVYGSLLILILSFGCGQSPNRGVDVVYTYPLETGNRWEYTYHSYKILQSNGAVTDTSSAKLVRRVLGIDTARSTLGLIMVDDSLTYFTEGEESYARRRWLRKGENKIYEVAGQFSPSLPPYIYHEPHLLLDMPLTEGKSWDVLQQRLSRNVIDVLYDTIGANTFYCAVVQEIEHNYQSSIYSNTWYSNYGIIEEHDSIFGYELDGGHNVIDSFHAYNEIFLLDYDVRE
jgi:hypothetical protein